MSDATLPGVRAALVDPGGTTSRPFYVFFQSQAANLAALSERVGVIESAPSSAGNLSHNANVIGAYSIAVKGTLRTGIARVTLEGDVEFAGATNYYGSDGTGAKGWYAISDALDSTANITLTVGTDGVTTIDLADLADSGTGAALVKITRDAKGRISGTQAATTSDLAEGSNLYFTVSRVLASALSGLSTASSAVITAADTVLSAFGKLQAQITALTSSLTGYVQTTRTISTTAPLTGGGDLSANRTLAIPAATTSVNGYLTSADWTTFNGKVSSARTITAGTGLSGGGDLSANRTLTLANTAVTPASYGDATHVATFTVDAQGRLTAAGSVAITAGAVSSVFGRTGTVVAAANDYTFAQIGSKPTTRSGYGITDAEGTITAGTTSQYWRGDKSWQTLDKSAVGLGNVDNTSDVNKPVSTAQAAANALKFDKTGGTLTGSLNMSGVGANGQVFFSGTPGGGNEGYVYTDSSNGLRFFFIIEATDKVVLCNRAANGVIHLRANNATVGGAGESTVAIVNTLGLLAGSDNTKTLGGSANRWSVVYAATGSINTSDAREKTDVATLTADELAAAADLARAPGTYQWLSAVQAKGANARKHVGLTVQRAIEIMQSHGLDPMSYGFICYDTWAESPEIVDRETGELTQQYQAAGDRYSFRHDELLLFIVRGFAARLEALESA